MKYKRSYFEFSMCRNFSIGFTISSPTLNGFHLELRLAVFIFRFWSKGEKLITFKNYWTRQS